MMKKIFTYITALIALAACTNDDSLVGLNNNLNP
ncbi:MAG: lipoprotein, partial [Prevotella sp.]|nr:lipoprotein [Candidatus Prevotella equi]